MQSKLKENFKPQSADYIAIFTPYTQQVHYMLENIL